MRNHMKKITNQTVTREMSLDEMKQVNGGWIVTIVGIAAGAAALTIISACFGDNEE